MRLCNFSNVNKKGVIVSAFFAVILLTSTVALSLPNLISPPEDMDLTKTGTPADNYPDAQRPQFCGSGIARSNTFVKEYSIPTVCTNPLAIVTDYEGNVWFTQTNTGNLGKFDPSLESFTEYENPMWPPNGRSMMWGMDYSPDGSLWYTDETFDSVWIFTPEDGKYQRLPYPTDGDSLPQKLKVEGAQIIVNDFTGNKITFLDPTQSDEELSFLSLPSPMDNSVTGDFAIDDQNNVWYTNWVFQQGGVLVKFDQEGYRSNAANTGEEFLPLFEYIDVLPLPLELLTPNGVTFTDDGKLWIADTSSSNFFSFNPEDEKFTQFRTSDPPESTYGNYSGIIKTPISRPYWVDSTDSGKIVFNEQTANRIAVMDPNSETLVEYFVPSMNPNWGDCGDMDNCGLAQIFDFTIDGEKIWFTEWVENNIGVVDTSIALPFDVELESNVVNIKAGESKKISFVVLPKTSSDLSDVSLILNTPSEFLSIVSDSGVPKNFQLDSDAPRPITLTLSASEDAPLGEFKILLGANTKDVSISKFLTVVIES